MSCKCYSPMYNVGDTLWYIATKTHRSCRCCGQPRVKKIVRSGKVWQIDMTVRSNKEGGFSVAYQVSEPFYAVSEKESFDTREEAIRSLRKGGSHGKNS